MVLRKDVIIFMSALIKHVRHDEKAAGVDVDDGCRPGCKQETLLNISRKMGFS